MRKAIIGILLIVGVLIVTNPTKKDLLEYLGLQESNLDQTLVLKRKNNFLIFSYYTISWRNYYSEEKYSLMEDGFIGVCKNIIPLQKRSKPNPYHPE